MPTLTDAEYDDYLFYLSQQHDATPVASINDTPNAESFYKGTFYVAWIGSHDGPAGRGLGVARSTDFARDLGTQSTG